MHLNGTFSLKRVLTISSRLNTCLVCITIQRDPKLNAKKNGAQLDYRDDIFSQLPPILRSDW